MQNFSKTHEKNVQTAVNGEQVSNILDNVENVPFALKGSTVKSILYWLFCFIAAVELSAALFFYFASLGAPQAVAAVGAVVLGCAIHFLLHSLLSITTHGMVFSKKRESQAMSNEVKTNIVLSIVLLATVALIVFFVGKKGFTSYRGKQYEIAQNEAKPKEAKKELGITADMLTNKKGKITGDKLEQLAAVTSATAKATDATVHAASVDREAYDNTTAQMTDIVGVSAFILELLLALLAYSIATAKFAAVYDEIARRNGSSQRDQAQQSTAQQAVTTTAQAASNTANNAPTVAPQAASQQAVQTVTTTEPKSERTGVTKRFNEYTENDQNAIAEKLKQDLERDMFYFSVDQIKAYLSRKNELITTVSDATTTTIKFHQPIVTDEITASVTDAVTAAPIQPKAVGFSDNRANKTGNEGRTVIQGFARKNEAKTPITASVTDAIMEKDYTHLRMCLWCESEYIYKIHNQKFCCEECRISAWNEKTGKQLRKVSKA